MCDQQRLRPACAFAQSDQSLCSSLDYSTSGKLLTEHHLEFISLKGGCTGSSESTFVKMPHCWKSHVMAQFLHNFSDGSFHEVYDELPQDTESEVSVKQWSGVNSIGHHPQNHSSSNNIPPGGKLPIYVYRE